VNKNKEFKIDGPNRLAFCPLCGEDGDVEIKEGYCLEKNPDYFANSAEKT
jgi:hypothetical protein